MEAQLQGADLTGAQLERANLSKAQLQKANLRLAWMQLASLFKAQLQGVNLGLAWMQLANLIETQLQQTQLQRANLFKARMQLANLSKAQLQGANLGLARMQGANLSKAQLQGTHLDKTQLQGANLEQVQLQGVSSREADHLPSAGFESRIESRIGEPSDLTGIIFAGGLEQKDLDTLCRGLSADQAQALRKKLTPHIGQPASHELPSDSDAVIGAYAQEEAEQWIAEYNKAMEGVPRTDDTANAASAPDSDKDKED